MEDTFDLMYPRNLCNDDADNKSYNTDCFILPFLVFIERLSVGIQRTECKDAGTSDSEHEQRNHPTGMRLQLLYHQHRSNQRQRC